MNESPTLTSHAKIRWLEHFPHLVYEEQWSQANSVGKKVRKKIRRQCPVTCCRVSRTGDIWYLMSPAKVVFVYNWRDNVVITVFPYSNGKKPQRSLS